MTTPLRQLSRRAFLIRSGLGLGAAALGSLARSDVLKKPHFEARAKHIIYMHMIGAPSQLDLFDPKPVLLKNDGQPCPEEFLRGKRFAFLGAKPVLAASYHRFKRFGQSGQQFSDLVPAMGRIADDICMIHSMRTDEINHAPGQLFLHTGFGSAGRPSLGSWIAYGLGSESKDLPAYVVLQSGVLAG